MDAIFNICKHIVVYAAPSSVINAWAISLLLHSFLFFMQDEFASLPAIVPEGPIAILGLVFYILSLWRCCPFELLESHI